MKKNLTDEEIQAIYELLDTMYVPVEEDRMVKGLDYIRDRVALCRAMQDQTHELVLKTGRALSWVLEQLIYNKSAAQVAETDQEREQAEIRVTEFEQWKASHAMVHTLVKRHGTLLNGTQRDIKLLADVMKQQIKLAEELGVDPTATEDVVQPVDLAAIGQQVVRPAAPDPADMPVPWSSAPDIDTPIPDPEPELPDVDDPVPPPTLPPVPPEPPGGSADTPARVSGPRAGAGCGAGRAAPGGRRELPVGAR